MTPKAQKMRKNPRKQLVQLKGGKGGKLVVIQLVDYWVQTRQIITNYQLAVSNAPKNRAFFLRSFSVFATSFPPQNFRRIPCR